MTREELMNLGIREDIAEGVMGLHEAELEGERAKGDEAFAQLSDAAARVRELEGRAALLAELASHGARQPGLVARLLDPSKEPAAQIEQLRQSSPYLFGGAPVRGGIAPVAKPPAPLKRSMNEFLRRR